MFRLVFKVFPTQWVLRTSNIYLSIEQKGAESVLSPAFWSFPTWRIGQEVVVAVAQTSFEELPSLVATKLRETTQVFGEVAPQSRKHAKPSSPLSGSKGLPLPGPSKGCLFIAP